MRGPGQPHRPNLFQTPEICHRRAIDNRRANLQLHQVQVVAVAESVLELEPEFQLNTSTPWKTGMAAHRAQRKGHLQIGEISCVVGLYTAGSTSSERISFHMLNEKTGNPRRRQLSKINRLGQSARPQGRRSASSSNFAGRGRDRSQAISAC
jgi:hypothetical protein